MKSNIYILLFLTIGLIITGCDQDDDDLNGFGCTDPSAENYNSNATDDDGSCIILGCTDPIATNYNPDATNDDNSCEYSNASMLNGIWDITSLDYSTTIDIDLFQQDISGTADNAGTWAFNSEDYTYSQDISFETEPFTISIPLVGDIDAPSVPVDLPSDGTWTLTNDDNVLVTTDGNTNIESTYEIISLTSETAFLTGSFPYTPDFGIDVGTLDIELQMILQKQ